MVRMVQEGSNNADTVVGLVEIEKVKTIGIDGIDETAHVGTLLLCSDVDTGFFVEF